MPDTEPIPFAPLPDRQKEDKRQTKDFIEIPGQHIKSRPHAHSRGDYSRDKYPPVETDMKVSERVRKEIAEGIETYKEQREAEEMNDENIFGIESEDVEDLLLETYEPPVSPPLRYFHSIPLSEQLAYLQEGMQYDGIAPEQQHQERKDWVERYKKGMYEQRRHIGHLITALRERVAGRPESTYEELMSLVHDYQPVTHLSSEQRDLFSQAIHQYLQKHAAVAKYATYRKSLPDDLEFARYMFNICFGSDAIGYIQVVPGPMSLMFVCLDPKDYIRIFCDYKISTGKTVTKKDMSIALSSGGAALATCRVPELAGTILARNRAPLSYRHDPIRIHEEEHAFNKLFTPLEQHEQAQDVFMTSGIEAKTREQAVLEVAFRYCRMKRKEWGIDSRARDEILAYYKDGRSPATIATYLIQDPLYNYAQQYDEYIKDIPRQLIADYQHFIGKASAAEEAPPLRRYFNVTPEVLQTMKDKIALMYDVVFTDMYHQDIADWLLAVESLEQKGYQREDILSLLYTTPASRWRQLARRTQDMHVSSGELTKFVSEQNQEQKAAKQEAIQATHSR